jgi:cytochrome c-type biogenesis protein CcmH
MTMWTLPPDASAAAEAATTTASAAMAWLWPFALAALALAGLLGASLAWAAKPPGAGLPRWARLGLWLGVPLAALGLYAWLGQPRALNPAARISPAAQMHERIARLSERLARQPDDAQGWLMLARSLKVTGQYTEADAAYARAGERVRQDANLLADWVEARILAADQHFDTTSLGLLTQAIALAPQHPKVLLLHGLASLDLDDPATARQVFLALRAQHPPGSADFLAMDSAIRRIDQGEDPRLAAPNTGAAAPQPAATGTGASRPS